MVKEFNHLHWMLTAHNIEFSNIFKIVSNFKISLPYLGSVWKTYSNDCKQASIICSNSFWDILTTCLQKLCEISKINCFFTLLVYFRVNCPKSIVFPIHLFTIRVWFPKLMNICYHLFTKKRVKFPKSLCFNNIHNVGWFDNSRTLLVIN